MIEQIKSLLENYRGISKIIIETDEESRNEMLKTTESGVSYTQSLKSGEVMNSSTISFRYIDGITVELKLKENLPVLNESR